MRSSNFNLTSLLRYSVDVASAFLRLWPILDVEEFFPFNIVPIIKIQAA